MLLAAGVDLLGFPLRLPVNKEDLSEAVAAEIIRRLNDKNRAVLITYLDNAEEILNFCDLLGVTIVQLHGPVALPELRKIKRKRSNIKIIKSLVVREDNRLQLFQDIEKFGDTVDAFITDTFDPESGASGATGKTHDRAISRELAEHSPKPVILAGGLTPDNVYEAIMIVRPDGVDAHTGVEGAGGRKDAEKLRCFVAEARRAIADLQNAG
ncbi:MAG: phosphoribosylanthranilate isomerase, partial [Candidatus Marinimicrobia bacterium]|nr:phosphoribosylanthranilate isomerase [Candidatus Neomarinimicrobiota bacterium]